MVVTAKELRLKTSEILRKVQRVGTVTVALRGKPVAKFLALNYGKTERLADDPAVGMWAR